MFSNLRLTILFICLIFLLLSQLLSGCGTKMDIPTTEKGSPGDTTYNYVTEWKIFNKPTDVTLDDKNNIIYVLDSGNNRYVTMKYNGTIVSEVKDLTSNTAEFLPSSIALAKQSGYAYISLVNKNTWWQVNPEFIRTVVLWAIPTDGKSRTIGVVGDAGNKAVSILNADKDLRDKLYTFKYVGDNWDYTSIKNYYGLIVNNRTSSLTSGNINALRQYFDSKKPIILASDDLDDLTQTQKDSIAYIFGVSGFGSGDFSYKSVNNLGNPQPSDSLISKISSLNDFEDSDNCNFTGVVDDNSTWGIIGNDNKYYVVGRKIVDTVPVRTVILGEAIDYDFITVKWYDNTGNFVSSFSSSNIGDVSGMAVDYGGYVYISDSENHKIVKCKGDTALQMTVLASYGSGYQGVINPKGLTLWFSTETYTNEIIVAVSGHNWIQKFDPLIPNQYKSFKSAGDTLNYIGKDDQTPSSSAGYFDSPVDVAIDALGYIYVVDNGNRRIQVFTKGGQFFNVRFNSKGHPLVNPVAITTSELNTEPGRFLFVVDKENGSLIEYARSDYDVIIE